MTHNIGKNFEMPPAIGKIIFICKKYFFKNHVDITNPMCSMSQLWP